MQVSKKFILLFSTTLTLLVAGCSTTGGLSKTSVSVPSQNPFNAPDTGPVKTWADANKLSLVRLFYVGNINGETDICGCALNPKGGIDRRLNFLKENKTPNSLVLDAGNSLFPSSNLDPSKESVLKQKAAALLDAHKVMGLAVQNVGHLDLSAGVTWLKAEANRSKTTLISANLANDKDELLFSSLYSQKLPNGVEVFVTGISDGKTGTEAIDVKALDPLNSLKKVLAGIPKGSPIVVLSDLGTEKDKILAENLAQHSLIIVGSRDLSSLENAIHSGSSILLRTQLQGQQWGMLDFAWSNKVQGFYNNELGLRYKGLWDGFAQDRAALIKEGDKVALANFDEDQSKRLLSYAPGDLSTRSVYELKLTEMGAAYSKKNELTPVLEKLRKLK